MIKQHFICIEGPDNCGKTTLQNTLQNYLISKGGYIVYTYNSPSKEHGSLGKSIRTLMNDNQDKMDNLERTLIAAAAIANNYRMIKHKAKHTLVDSTIQHMVHILDRDFISTLAYQAAQEKNAQKRLLIENLIFILFDLNPIDDTFTWDLDFFATAQYIFCRHKFKPKENDTEFDPTRDYGETAIDKAYERVLSDRRVSTATQNSITLSSPEDYLMESEVIQSLKIFTGE